MVLHTLSTHSLTTLLTSDVIWFPGNLEKHSVFLCVDTVLSLAWPEAAPGAQQSRWCSCHLQDRSRDVAWSSCFPPHNVGTQMLHREKQGTAFPHEVVQISITSPTRVSGSQVWAPVHSWRDWGTTETPYPMEHPWKQWVGKPQVCLIGLFLYFLRCC